VHELGIAGEILNVVLSEAIKHEAKEVTVVTVRVGVLRGIVPENLRFLFENLARGTFAEGAALAIEEEPVQIECNVCGTTEAAVMAWECPACKAPDIFVKGGDSLRIVSIDLDTE
jgi:hydrogenase nickel incorporation protein HypA/HybF